MPARHSPRDGSRDILALEMASLAQLVQSFTVALAAGSRRGGHAGTGVVWHPDGLIVTNAHVATRGSYQVTLATGDQLEGEVIARDAKADLAAVAVPARGLHPAPLGEAAALRAGSLVLALGHPLGVANALALGIVHHVVRDASGDARWIAADIQLAPGNSGGPLVDATGRLVGINAMIVSGLGAAIPVDVVAKFLNTTVGRATWSTEMWAA
jgi:serine protease Do